MILFLIVVCILGGFVQAMEASLAIGAFGSAANVPGILTYSLGNFLVLALGIVVYWGCCPSSLTGCGQS